jgi:acyl-CoA thioesterase
LLGFLGVRPEAHVQPLFSGGGRGVRRGTIVNEAGRIVASVTQEMLLTVVGAVAV